MIDLWPVVDYQLMLISFSSFCPAMHIVLSEGLHSVSGLADFSLQGRHPLGFTENFNCYCGAPREGMSLVTEVIQHLLTTILIPTKHTIKNLYLLFRLHHTVLLLCLPCDVH